MSQAFLSFLLAEHRHYLADDIRLSAYQQAIDDVIQPGDVVLDLGAGTGILGLLACRAGAARVYAVESGPIVELARQISRANRLDDRIIHIIGRSTEVELPELVDVVLADQVGYFGFEAGAPEYYADAVRRLLKPSGATIPHRIDLYVAPVECIEAWANIVSWNKPIHDFSLLSVAQVALNTCYPVTLSQDHLLAEPVSPKSINLRKSEQLPFRLHATVIATRAGTLHGLGGWFSAQLSPSVTMSNSPLAEHPINRANLFLPIEKPVNVEEGDSIQIEIHAIPNDVIISWKVKVLSTRTEDNQIDRVVIEQSFSHSTWKSMLISKETLHQTKPDFIPSLSSRGEIRQAILGLCDGIRTVAEVEQTISLRYAEKFNSEAELLAFVGTVIGQNSE